jgi:hypothetical protein
MAKRIEKRDEQLRTERFRENDVIPRDGDNEYEEYQYEHNEVTPKKNPLKKSYSPYKKYTPIGSILDENFPIPETETEHIAYQIAEDFLSQLQYNKYFIQYIKLHIDGAVPPRLNRPQLTDIAFKLKYREEISKTGKGMRQIEGRGIEKLAKNPDKIELNNGKFILDMEKLNRNILSVTYASCRASLPSLKREHVSNDVKNIIKDIVENKYNANLFNKMNPDDQRIVSTFVRTMKIPNIDMREFNEAYNRHFQVLEGQLNAGQNSPSIKRELKAYYLRAIQENLIPKNQGYNKLFELSL